MTDYTIGDTPTEDDGLSVRLFDNGGIGTGGTFDRYTAVFDADNGESWYVAMSEHPYHPQGFGQHGEGDVSGVLARDREISVAEAPPDVRKCIEQDVAEWATWRAERMGR